MKQCYIIDFQIIKFTFEITIICKKLISVSMEKNKAAKSSRVNPETLKRALRTLKSRIKTDDLRRIREIQEEYSTGMQFALGLGYETFIKRFRDPRFLTLEDLLNCSDITETDVMELVKIAIAEAQNNHMKRDITNLLEP